jgi:hypothetical protein
MKFLSSLITLFRIAAEHSNNLRTTRGKLVMPAAMPASGQHPYSMYICGTKQKIPSGLNRPEGIPNISRENVSPGQSL